MKSLIEKKKRKKYEKRTVPMVFMFAIAFFFAGAGSFLAITHISTENQVMVRSAPEPTSQKTNPIDLSLAQYSDTHITTNAIDSNEKFRSLALADYMDADNSFFSATSQTAALGSITLSPGEKEYGTWIWTPIPDMTPQYIDSVVQGAKSNGINTIYVSVDSYLDVYVMPTGPDKNAKKKAFADTLERFVAAAHAQGIAVDAEAGWRNWAEDGNTYKAFAIINFIKEFNRNQKYTLSGFQYDVEPYLLPAYQSNPVSVLRNYIRLVDQSITLLGTSNLKLSIVIPDFYDKDQSLVPSFEYNGKKGFAYKHLLDALERRPKSDIVVMSYRNFATGDDSSTANANTEVETATNGMYTTNVIVAQETGDVLPSYITFNNTSKRYYSSQISAINKAFDPYANFGGIAVHYVNAFLTLK